ncbi:MAG: precorrin-4 C(11)-methyltransferase [Planctomycetota bacterium]
MTVYFIGAGPGDPELLTVRGQKLLRECGCCIYAGSLVNPELLELLPEDAERHNSAEMDLEQIIELCLQRDREGLNVARLHSGDPSIYGAIGEQIRELRRLEVACDVVPGVSSFQAAAAALRSELTAPEISQTVILTRTGGRTPMPEPQRLEKLAESQATLCIFLSIQKIDEVVDTLIPHYGEDCPAAVVYRVSWPDEMVLRGKLADIGTMAVEAGIKKSALIIVGQALAGPEASSRLYDRHFSHGFREGEAEEE